MKSIAISANERAQTGAKGASQLRKGGQVPGVLYGGKENKHFSLRALDIRTLTHTTLRHVVDLDIEGNVIPALLKEVQYHPITDQPIHVDFIELVSGVKTKVRLAVKLVGQSAGVRLGGKLSQPLRSLVVLGDPALLPEQIEVDITEMNVGDSVRIKDLNITGGEILGRDDSVIAAVKTARTVVEEETVAEEGAEGEGAAPAEGEEAPKEG